MPSPRSSRRLLAALWLLLAGLPARGETLWHCWYDQATHVVCALAAADPQRGLSAEEWRIATETRPTTLQASLPPVVQWLRQRPGAFRGRIMVIPLHAEPIDHRMVGELAQAVMCGAARGCRAVYAERLEAGDSSERLMAFVDAHDPLLAE